VDANFITVLAGMLGSVSGASAIAIFLIPVTFYVIERLFAGRKAAPETQGKPSVAESPARAL
jgi:hypothetical protein